MGVRKARHADASEMVALIERKRREYEKHRPLYWRKAADSAATTLPYFERLIADEGAPTFVCEAEGRISGFIIATVMDAPPPYDIGGKACLIDDFMVADHADWGTVGPALMSEAIAAAGELGAVEVLVISGDHDKPKAKFLRKAGLLIASNWWTRKI